MYISIKLEIQNLGILEDIGILLEKIIAEKPELKPLIEKEIELMSVKFRENTNRDTQKVLPFPGIISCCKEKG